MSSPHGLVHVFPRRGSKRHGLRNDESGQLCSTIVSKARDPRPAPAGPDAVAQKHASPTTVTKQSALYDVCKYMRTRHPGQIYMYYHMDHNVDWITSWMETQAALSRP
jgi:hypothetical protein